MKIFWQKKQQTKTHANKMKKQVEQDKAIFDQIKQDQKEVRSIKKSDEYRIKYYILTSNTKFVLATTNLDECYDFIIKHPKVKVKTLSNSGKPMLIETRVFVKRYFEHNGEYIRLFTLIRRLVKGNTNFLGFIRNEGLKLEYEKYKILTKNNL